MLAKIKSISSSVSNSLLKQIYSKQSICCDSYSYRWNLCKRCFESLRYDYSKEAVDGLMVHSLFQYDGPWVDLVYRLKYNQEKHLALKIISESIIKDGFEKVILVPIPLTLGRYRERGYNQAKEIALALQKKLGTECEILDLLKRNRFSRSQTSLNKGQRKKNLESTFGVNKRVFLKNRSKLQSHKIIIVDDVFTTGATLLSANDLLNEWGIRNIEGFVLARASLKSEMPKDLLSLAIFGPDYGFVTRNNNGQN